MKWRRGRLFGNLEDVMDTIPEFGIERENEERRDGGCGVVFDPKTQKYAVGRKGDGGAFMLFSGGVQEREDIQAGVLREVTEESGLHSFLHVEKIGEALAHYYNSLRKVNRIAHATCFLVILENSELVPVKLEQHETFLLEWATAEEILQNWESHNSSKGLDHWIYFFKKAILRAKELGYDTTSTV